MKCQFCPNPATVHLTDIVNNKKREMHLCDSCAREHDLLPESEQELNVPALLQFLISQSHAEKAKTDANALACPCCGLKYAQFRAQGRLGCPADYEAFKSALLPLLERIHRHTAHLGKVPAALRQARRERERVDLRRQLDAAVRDERYEEAARLRDLIRGLE